MSTTKVIITCKQEGSKNAKQKQICILYNCCLSLKISVLNTGILIVDRMYNMFFNRSKEII